MDSTHTSFTSLLVRLFIPVSQQIGIAAFFFLPFLGAYIWGVQVEDFALLP